MISNIFSVGCQAEDQGTDQHHSSSTKIAGRIPSYLEEVCLLFSSGPKLIGQGPSTLARQFCLLKVHQHKC